MAAELSIELDEDGRTPHAVALYSVLTDDNCGGRTLSDEESEALVGRCMTHAEATDPCFRNDIRDFPITMFISFGWTERHVEATAHLFATYIRLAYIDVDRPIDAGSTGMYSRLSSKRPLMAAVHRGRRTVASHLVMNGADVDFEVDGVPFAQWAMEHAGQDPDQGFVREPQWRAEFATHLIELHMKRQISLAHPGAGTPSPAPSSAQRRARCL